MQIRIYCVVQTASLIKERREIAMTEWMTALSQNDSLACVLFLGAPARTAYALIRMRKTGDFLLMITFSNLFSAHPTICLKKHLDMEQVAWDNFYDISHLFC